MRIFSIFILFCLLFAGISPHQSYGQNLVFAELKGNPVDTTNWNFNGDASINGSEIVLVRDSIRLRKGSVFYKQPINLSKCIEWIAEFDFSIGPNPYGADGLAFCFLDVPPSGFVYGGDLGIPSGSDGLKIAFDTWDNTNGQGGLSPEVPKIEIRYGPGYSEGWAQPTLKNTERNLKFLHSGAYIHARIKYVDGNISVYINNDPIPYLTGIQKFNFTGYFGFTAATGDQTDLHTIKNVVIYTNTPKSFAGQDITICSGSSTQIGGNSDPAFNYLWTPAAGLNNSAISNPKVTLINNTLLPATTQYIVSTYLSLSPTCSSEDTVLVTVNPLPKSSITGTTSICSGSSTNISFSGTPNTVVTYTINGANQTISLDGTGSASISTGALTSTTTYTLVSVAFPTSPGCSQVINGSAVVTIVPLPAATITGTATICSGSSATVSFTGTPNAVVIYTINGVANKTIILDGTGNASVSTGNLIATTTYSLVSVSYSTTPGCSQPISGNATLTVLPLPAATIAGTASICSGSSTNISFSGTPNTVVAYTINGANQTITLDGTGNYSLSTGALTATTTYSLVSISYPANPGCSQIINGNAVVTIVALPTATISGNATICSGNSATVSFSGTPNAVVSYTMNGIAKTITLDGTGNAVVSTGLLTVTTTYSLTSVSYSTTPGCSQPISGNAIITVLPLPAASITGTASICSGSSTTISFSGTPNTVITFTINGGANQTIPLDGTGNASISTGALTATITYSLVSISYSVNPGCSQPIAGTAVVTIVQLPSASITGNTTICSGSSATVSFTGTPNAVVSYTINGGANKSITLDATGNASVSTGVLTATTTYSLVSVSYPTTPGCSQPIAATVVVTIVPLPAATITGTATICSGSSATISFSGTPNAVVTYNINGGANKTVTLGGTGNASVPTGVLSAATIYNLVSVSYSTTPGCSQPISGNAILTVLPLPAATISGIATICLGSSTNISFSGTPNTVVTYTINGGANKTISIDGTGNASISTGALIATTTYSLVSISYSANPGCSQTINGTAVVTIVPLPAATISGNATICSGSSATISFSGTPNAVITYTINGGANKTITLDGTGNASVSTGALTINATYILTSVSYSITPGCSQTISGNTTITVLPLPAVNITGTASICSGSSTNISFSGTPNTVVTYKINTGSNQTITLDGTGNYSLPTGALTATTTYTLVSISYPANPGCSQIINGTVVVTIVPLPAATISGNATICPGISAIISFSGTSNAVVTYTINSGANKTITLDGTGNASVSTGALNATTTYSLVSVSYPAGPVCSQPLTGTAVVIVNSVTPSVLVVASSASICAGSSIIFTATPANGGTFPVYQWQINGSNVGTNSNTFSSNTLSNGDIVEVVMTTNAICATTTTVRSNQITITTNSVTPSVIIAASSASICAGGSVTFTATPINGGIAPAYQWQINGANAGTNSNIFSSTTIVNGDIVKVIMTSNASCATTASAASNQITITTNSVTPSVNIVASSTSICAGASITFTATPINGGTSPVYQWQVNGVNAGTVTGSNIFTSPLSNGDLVKVIMTTNAPCATAATVTSNQVSIITNSVTPSVLAVASSTSICAGASITFTATPANGGTFPVYQWQINGLNVGTNSNTFSSNALSNGDIIEVVMTTNAVCATTSIVKSNQITITTNSVTPSVSIVASSTSICAGAAITFTAIPVNGGNTPIYQWQVNGVNAGTSNSTFTSAAPANNDAVKVIITSNASCTTTSSATSNTVIITTNSVTPTVSVIASSTSICAGASIIFTATPANSGTSPVYQWQVNGVNAGTNSNTFSSATLANNDAVNVIMTSDALCATTNIAVSNQIVITTNSVTPSVSIVASSTNICAGGSVTFTATPINGGTSPVYQWQVNGVNAGTNSNTFSSTTIANNDVVNVIMTSNASCTTTPSITSNTIAITTNSITPSVSIVASSTSICAGGSVTFTATPVNGGTLPVYQWQINGVNAGTNSNTFSSTILNNGDIVEAVMTTNAACATVNTATSNQITMSTNSITPSVIITTSSTNVCAGSTVIFTATPTNGGTSPVYQWQVNGVNAGTNSSTFSLATLANNDAVKVIMTSNASCATTNTAVSNQVVITTNSVTPSVSVVASSTSVCAGASITFTATPINGGTSPVYLWQINGVNAGTTNNIFSSNSLINGDVVKVIMTSNASCAAIPIATSNQIIITTNSVTPSVSIVASSTNICAGGSVTFTATPVNGGTSPVYQWQINGVNAGSNSSTFSSTTIANNDAVKVIMTSNASCTTTPSTTSNTISITTSSITPSVSIIASSTSICAGGSVTFTATPVNGGTLPVYQWQINGVNAGTNSNTFSSTTLNNGDIIEVVMTTNVACATANTARSNQITMSTNSITPSVIITTSSTNVCAGSTVIFTATPTNGGTSPVYQWQVNGVNARTNSNTFSSATLNNSDAVNVIMTSNASCATTNTAVSNQIVITTNSVTPSVSIIASSTNICAGGSVTFTATPVNGGTSPVYQWQVNGVNAGTNSSTFSSTTIANNDAVKVIMTSNASCTTTPSTTSNTISITTSSITPSVSIIASSTSICAGGSVTFTATPVNGGTLPVYQWQINGVNAGTNSNTFSTASLFNNDIVRVIMTSAAVCALPSSVTSNAITIKTNSITPSVSVVASSTKICAGSTVTFTANPTNGGTSPVYLWQINGINVGTISNTFTTAKLINNDIIRVMMTSNASCTTVSSVTADLTISVNPNPVVTLDHTPGLCERNSKKLSAGNFATYLWNDGSTGNSLVIFGIGTYYVTVADTNGCKATDTTRITTILPTPSLFLPRDTVICSYDEIVVKSNTLFNKYLWSNNNTTQSIRISAGGIYWLDATNSYGCTGRDSILVTSKPCIPRFYVPNAFTPDGNNVNDIFKPVISGKVKKYDFTIFNRWGQVIFNSNDYNKGWNGLIKGMYQQTNIFIWVCNYQFEGEEIKSARGTVLLIK